MATAHSTTQQMKEMTTKLSGYLVGLNFESEEVQNQVIDSVKHLYSVKPKNIQKLIDWVADIACAHSSYVKSNDEEKITRDYKIISDTYKIIFE